MSYKPNTIIESIGVYLPPESVSTSDVLLGCHKPLRFPFEKISGIKSRRVAGREEFSIHLAQKAIADCLSKSKYNPPDIDLLICCNISRYDGLDTISFEPSTSVKLRDHFSFTNALAFDITNACAGMFTGIHILNIMIKTGAIRRGMVVSGEYITHLTETAQKELDTFLDSRLACLTLGDAGAALILEKSPNRDIGFQEFEMQTFGRYSKYCIAKASDRGGMIMLTDSVALTDAAVRSGAMNAIETLHKAGWEAKDIQHLILHQTSTMTLNTVRNEINRLMAVDICHDRNTINNLEERGNTASTSHFVALVDSILRNEILSGEKVVFSIAASGLTSGTALYVLDDLPDRLLQPNVKNTRAQSDPGERIPDCQKPIVPIVRIESIGTVPKGLAEKLDSLDLLKRAAENSLKKSSYIGDDIDTLIYCGIYRNEYVLEPAYATLLAGELNMEASSSGKEKSDFLAFDVFNGGVGFLNACFLVQQMIRAGNCLKGMVVASEIENNAAKFSEELLGICETASAVVLDGDPKNQSGFSAFLFKYHPASINHYMAHCDVANGRHRLRFQKSAAIEETYIQIIIQTIKELLSRESLQIDQVDLFIPPQISSSFITRLAEALNLPRKQFVDVVGNGPDLFSSSIPFALEHIVLSNLAKPGDKALLIAAGSGLQVGCAVYQF